MIRTCLARSASASRGARVLGFPLLLMVLATVSLPRAAHADEEDDIQRQIDAQKAGVPDLELLDHSHAAASEIQRLRDWLGQAWDLRNKHEPDEAREVLERCMAEAELIRQIITASQLKAQVAEREAKLDRTKTETEKKKKALQEAQIKKRSLESAVGS
ncbi:MAG TPA: hypothetical protein VIU64_05545 [Polyangia bacterium]